MKANTAISVWLARGFAGPFLGSYLILCSAALGGTINPDEVESHVSASEIFKSFLASPPNIEQLSCRKLSISDRTNGLQVADWLGTKNVSETFLFARWQPGCLFVRSATNSVDSLIANAWTGELFGRTGSSFWSRAPKGLTTIWQDLLYAPTQVHQGPSLSFHNRARDAFDVVNMGIMYLEPGAVKWEGDAFSANGYIPELKLSLAISGNLRTGADHFASELDVQYKSRIAIWNYKLKYSYGTNASLRYLPERFESFFVSGEETRKLAEWQILALRTSHEDLKNSWFELSGQFVTNSNQVLYFTNNNWYARNALGVLSPVVLSADPAPEIGGLNDHKYYFGAVAVEVIGNSEGFLLKTRT